MKRPWWDEADPLRGVDEAAEGRGDGDGLAERAGELNVGRSSEASRLPHSEQNRPGAGTALPQLTQRPTSASVIRARRSQVYIVVRRVPGSFSALERWPRLGCLADIGPRPRWQDPFDPFKFLGGTFTPFGCNELLNRYGSHEEYVKRVERAAGELAAERYITPEDGRALIVAAQKEPFPPTCASGDGDR